MTSAALKPSVSVVIPAFNEEENIGEVLDKCAEVLPAVTADYEIIVVDDDSTDATPGLVRARSEADAHIRLIMAGANIGANAAALLGMRNSRYDACFFIPADLQILPDQIRKCLPALADADYVCTHRRHRADPWHRRAMAGAYNAAVRLAFKLPTHDVDSTILVRRQVIETIAPELTSASDFLPVEMIARARFHGYRITEVTIDHHPRVAGKPAAIKPAEVLKTLRDMLRSIVRLRRLLKATTHS